MQLRDFTRKVIKEGGNMSIDGHDAQQIDLKVHNRAYIVPVLDNLLQSINNEFGQQFGGPLWSPKVLKSREFLSGSSLHFFNTDIPDDEFTRVKPKVGDIDTQVNKDAEPHLEQWLNGVQGKVVGNAKLLGYQRGNEQFSSLWELTDPPIKVQIDLEFVKYDEKGKAPTDWSKFSHSSSWDDLSQGIKGVFHKFLIQSFTRLTSKEFLLRKMVGRGKARVEQDVPTTDNMFSFAVSSKEGGGLRPKYEPVLDEKGRPLVVDGLPVMRPLPASGYEQDIGKIFQAIFDKRIDSATLRKLLPKTWSFMGLLGIMNLVLEQEEKEQILDGFVDKIYGAGAQGLYKNDADRDVMEKNVALNQMLAVLKVTPPKNLEQMRQEYKSNYKMTTEGPIGLDKPLDEDGGPPEVKAQFRKGMPHLRDLKPVDFLDLLDEIHDGNGRFKLQNIPLNVKVDGFGGRFGKSADGRPFMATSNTPPRFEAGFVKHHQQKGTTDPEILGRAQIFDNLFSEMMNAVAMVDAKLGQDFLVNKQVTCEVLYLPFATETDDGKLKFVGIAYDKLPKGVQLALVPFRVVDASTGDDLPDANKIVTELTRIGKQGSVMFIDNSLKQKDGLDVTEIINPLENLEELRKIVSDTAGKRDRASLQLRKEVEEKLMPVKLAFEKAVSEDPNILGKDILGQDYEGIVINSRLGPIKITSQTQKDVITQKNAARAAVRASQAQQGNIPQTENKTAVVAIGSFVGHRGHEELLDYTIKKAQQVGGDPYLFIGNAEGKDDPIPPAVKVQTWHKMYPQLTKNISTVQSGGSLMQKIKHELIQPQPGKAPRYDNIIIMVGEDQAKMNIANALMKSVNRFPGYENVKVSLEVTPRGTGMSFTKLRNILKDPNSTPEQQYAVWAQGFDEQKLGKEWILHLMDLTRKGMGIAQQPAAAPQPVAEVRLFNALVRPSLLENNNMANLKSEEFNGEYDDEAGMAQSNLRTMARAVDGLLKTIKSNDNLPEWGQEKIAKAEMMLVSVWDYLLSQKELGMVPKVNMAEATSAAIRLQRAIEKQRAKSDASLRRTPSSIPRPEPKKEQGVEEGKLGTAAALAGAIALGGAMGYKHATKDPNAQPTIKTKYERNAEVGAKLKKKISGDQKNEGAPIVVAQAPIHIRNPKKAPQPYRNQGDIVPPTKPPSTEKRGVKGRPGQRPMPNHDKVEEKMLPKSVFAGTKVGQKVGSAGQWKNTGPSKNRPAKAGDLVGGSAEESIQREAKKKGADGKACWKGYRYNGTENGKDKCVPVSEDVENILEGLVNKIIFNEAVQNNKRRS
jgi:hypothetical protein